MNEMIVKYLMGMGYPIVCATCEHMWDALRTHRESGGCYQTEPCGSVFSGRDFPLYRGPIQNFTQWCFVCGEEADYAVQSSGMKRALGMCRFHIKMLKDVLPKQDTIQIVSPQGIVSVKALLRTPLTLADVFKELDREDSVSGSSSGSSEVAESAPEGSSVSDPA